MVDLARRGYEINIWMQLLMNANVLDVATVADNTSIRCLKVPENLVYVPTGERETERGRERVILK